MKRPLLRPRPSGLSPGGPPKDTQRRWPRLRRRAAIASGTALALCVYGLIVCAFAAPGFVLGAEPPTPSLSETEANKGAATAGADIAAVSSSSPSEGDLLVTLPWGDEAGEVGLVQPVEGLTRGPEALAVAPDGRIAVLDSVNRRLVLLDPGGQVVETVPVALAQPRLLAVDDERLYVLDCDTDRRLVALGWDGRDLGATALPQLQDVVTGLFATSEGPCVEVAHDRTLVLPNEAGASHVSPSRAGQRSPVAGPGESTDQDRPVQSLLRELPGRPIDRSLSRMARVTFRPGCGVQIGPHVSDKSGLNVSQTADVTLTLALNQAIDHLVSVDGDGHGGMLVGARLVEPEEHDGTWRPLMLTRLASSQLEGKQTAGTVVAAPTSDVLFLADSAFAYLGQPYVVAPDGRIFQPVGSEGGYSIIVHTFPGDAPSTESEGGQP